MNKHKTQAVWLAVLLLLFFLSACNNAVLSSQAKSAQPRAGETVSVITPDFFGLGEDLTLQLFHNYRPAANPIGVSLIMTTITDLDNLSESSRFGRTLSEAMATQLFRHGFEVEELRRTKGLIMHKDTGELVLSRDVERLALQQSAHAIIAGTYSLTPQTVIINVRMLDANSHSVLSVAGMELERSPTINGMLEAGSGRSFLQDRGLSGYER